jgi:hypothetical protein
MGQYHHPVCIEAEVGHNLHELGRGFTVHHAWRQVEAARAARDVPAGHSWAFIDHRSMAEVITDEKAQTA